MKTDEEIKQELDYFRDQLQSLAKEMAQAVVAEVWEVSAIAEQYRRRAIDTKARIEMCEWWLEEVQQPIEGKI